MRMLKLRDLTDLASLRPNSWGIREFDAGSAQEREDALAEDGSGQGLDLILMPGLSMTSLAASTAVGAYDTASVGTNRPRL